MARLATDHGKLAAKCNVEWKEKGGRIEDFALRGQKPVYLSVKKAKMYQDLLEQENFYHPGVTSEEDVCQRVGGLWVMKPASKQAAVPVTLVDKLTSQPSSD